VNKSFVKLVTDLGPLIVFFFFYYNSDKNLKVAIPPFIIATLIAIIIVWLMEKKNSHDSFNRWDFNFIIWWTNYLF